MGEIVGLTGRKYHGKDTAAQVLVEHGYKQMRFADPLKNMLRAFYRTCGAPLDIIERKIEGDLKESPCRYLCGRTPRYAMQTLGTEWGRALIDDCLWVNALKIRCADADKVVVSDVRFGNECAAIHDIGGMVLRVDASKRVGINAFSNHASETAIDTLPVDGSVDNNGKIETLRGTLAEILLH